MQVRLSSTWKSPLPSAVEKSTFQLWPAWRWFKYCYKKLPLLTIYINILLQINDWAEILSLVFILEYSILFGAIFHIKDIFQNLFQCWVALLVQTYCQCKQCLDESGKWESTCCTELGGSSFSQPADGTRPREKHNTLLTSADCHHCLKQFCFVISLDATHV